MDQAAAQLSRSFAAGTVDTACLAAVTKALPDIITCSLSVAVQRCVLVSSSNLLAKGFITLSLPLVADSVPGRAIQSRRLFRTDVATPVTEVQR